MTAPIWMALPPEVHSALLSSGPGPGPLQAAAGAWTSLSTEYAEVADELSALVGAVAAGAWEGPTAERYAAANAPYVVWLLRASADSSVRATQHETAATAYTAALAAMPTLPELAANHAVHGVLLATNFFGINTIPIALNEADYARMWIQAATTMTAYQAVSTAAVAATPQTTAAPQIVKTTATTSVSPPTIGQELGGLSFSQALTQEIQFAEYVINLALTMPTNPQTLSLLASQAYNNFFVQLPAELSQIAQNPLLLLNPETLIILFPFVLGRIYDAIVLTRLILQFPETLAVGLGLAITNLSAVTGFAAASGLAGLAGLAGMPTTGAEIIPIGTESSPSAALAPAAPISVSPSSAPTTAPAPTSAPVPPTAPPPAPVGGAEALVYPYLIGGGPGVGFDARMSASDSAQKKAPEPDNAAAAAAATATREQARARRRRRAVIDRGHRYEYLEAHAGTGPGLDMTPTDRYTASDRGAGWLGFAGTLPKTAAQAAGLTALAGDEFGGGPSVPMMPGSWGENGPDGEEAVR